MRMFKGSYLEGSDSPLRHPLPTLQLVWLANSPTKMPLPPFRGCVLVVKKGLDANVLLRTSLVHDLRHFYKAAERTDYTTGLHLVHKSLQFIGDLETLGLLRKHSTRRLVNKRGARSVKGRNPIFRESSRLGYRSR